MSSIRSLRLRFALALALASAVLGASPSSHAIGESDPCLATLPPGVIPILGTEDADQITGTTGNDWILALGGNDVIRGLGGNDSICGGDGNDGVQGGPGNDVLGGGAGTDMLQGREGDDHLFLGDGDDSGFGGDGIDVLYDGADDFPDYLAGGAGSDSLNLGSEDEGYQFMQSDTDCPTLAHAKIGVYNPARLQVVDPASPCKTITATITDIRTSGDGDRKFELTTSGGVEYKIELMPRDYGHFHSGLANDSAEGDTITVKGLEVEDLNHGSWLEIHPVYKITYNGTTKYSGPWRAGSPWSLRPANGIPAGTNHRYCWNEDGTPCKDWNGGSSFE